MLTVSVFLLASGAAARITRFLTRDYLTRHLRAWALARWDEDHDVPYLLRCGWCMSVWVFAAVFSVAYFYGDTFLFPWIAGALTGSYLYGLVSSVFDEPDEEPARE